jgi:SAM-dependent methyltransferase
MDRYYPSQYRAYGPLVSRILTMLYGRRVSRWAKLKPQGGSVLEVGCGPGLMLAAFQRRGWSALGIERNEGIAEKGRAALGVRIVATPVKALPANDRFDLIVIFQVLEHIDDPAALLKECVQRLAPGGRLIVGVPNFASWQAQFSGPKWFHLDVPRHRVHFSPKTLGKALESAGLELKSLNFVSLEHDPYGWVESSLNRITGRPNTITRFLMGLDPLGPLVLLCLVLGAALAPAALVLSVISWVAGTGGLMEATAVIPTPRAD